jgi:hypothetical protein
MGEAGVIRAAWRLSLDAALEEVAGAFAADGVQPLLLKGPAFARWLYDDPSERSYVDLDLLVAPEQLEPARRTLAGCGYEQVAQRAHAHQRDHHETWVRIRPPAVIELHHTVFLLEASPQLVWQRFAEHPEAVVVGAVEVKVPGPGASALLVALHALLHGVGHPKTLRDLERALERVERSVWEDAAGLARDLGGEDAFGASLRLVARGRPLATELGLPDRPAPRTLRLLASTDEPGIAIERLLATAGFGSRLRVVGSTVMPTPRFMRVRYALARRSRRGLVCAYLLRPLELAVKLPGAMHAWLSAARSARRA